MSHDGEEMRFRGVRKRKWGKYVAEIRSGKRSRISLGSYFTPEAAARAYDTALLCLRGPHASSFNFPDSQLKSSALKLAEHTSPSPYVIRTAAIAVGSASDTVPARHFDNVDAEPSADREVSTHFGQGVSDQKVAEAVQEEEDMCELGDAKYLLQSPEQISFEERIQLSLLLPQDQKMIQPNDQTEILSDLSPWDPATFQATLRKPSV